MDRARAVLMKRLGYTDYVAQGGDWGAFVVDQMGLQAPAGCSPSTPTCRPRFQRTSTKLCCRRAAAIGDSSMKIAVLTLEGFNEIDSFVASAMLNRVKSPELRALIVCPTPKVKSMNGVAVESQAPLSFAREADAVIVGSGIGARELVRDAALMAELCLDPSRQVIGAQCSGALVLAKLGLLGNRLRRARRAPRPGRSAPAPGRRA